MSIYKNIPNSYEMKYMEFIKDVYTDPFKIKLTEFDVLFYLGTIVQDQYIDKLLRCLKLEIECRSKRIKYTKM